jgi:hypothetical protein
MTKIYSNNDVKLLGEVYFPMIKNSLRIKDKIRKETYLHSIYNFLFPFF